jgi:hypothetical protein
MFKRNPNLVILNGFIPPTMQSNSIITFVVEKVIFNAFPFLEVHDGINLPEKEMLALPRMTTG